MASLVDSCVFIALFSEEDAFHNKASALSRTLVGRIYVPYCVMNEVVTVLTYKHTLAHAKAFLAYLTQNEQIVIVGDDAVAEMVFFETLAARISFTDAALLHLAQKLPAELITFDTQLKRLYKKLCS